MLQDWHSRFPGRIESMAKALKQVVPSHLADNTQFNFTSLKTQNTPYINGDTGFDPPVLPSVKSNESTDLAVNFTELLTVQNV
jgi:tRNA 2-thiocytidine biosynthesis protein TtcA